ncbi:MAG: YqgE/AlgH family protein [Chthoniobacterales bacterium]|nr:YqgE/AlgH family protein [Chthoniobacterales bacterium]
MRNRGEDGSQNLAGLLLIAHPNMLDPNFRRSVLFISSHDPSEGAMGVILNRPLDKQVGDLVSDEKPPQGLADVPVFLGGPVGKNQLMFAAFEWEDANGLKLNHNVNVDEAHELVEDDPASIRAFVGHAGWSAGQLEAEMKQKAWILQKPSRDALSPDRLPKLWFEIMSGLGPWYKLLAAAPDDPSLN